MLGAGSMLTRYCFSARTSPISRSTLRKMWPSPISGAATPFSASDPRTAIILHAGPAEAGHYVCLRERPCGQCGTCRDEQLLFSLEHVRDRRCAVQRGPHLITPQELPGS